jgi:DUF971 family protein
MIDPESSPPESARETDLTPVSIEREGDAAIVITWSDTLVTRWTVAGLRKACPCATCREKKRSKASETSGPGKPLLLPVLSAAEARPLRIDSMRPVGSYAYNIAFSDGHSSGIYPFAMLHKPQE